MTLLDLGALVGRVMLDTTTFDRAYARVVTRMESLGKSSTTTSGSTDRLAASLDANAASADKAGAAFSRASAAASKDAAAQEKASTSTTAHSDAAARLSAEMDRVAGMTAREQQAMLRLTSAQARLVELNDAGTASYRQMASAQATVIGAQRSLAAAQKETAVVGRGGMFGSGGALGMAKDLGLIIGAVEAFKAVINITKQANDFHRAMVQTQTTANVSAAEINKASGALLAMAGPVAAAPADLATAWYHAKSVGLDYAKSIDVTRIAAEGAKIGHASLEETMNALTSTVASGIPGVNDMGSAMGQLLSIVGSGDMKLSDLNSALGSGILTVVKGYGLSLTDVGAALATFGDNNIRGAQAATMLRMAVQAMAVPAKAGSKLLGELGLTSEGSAAALAKVHLTTSSLARDMQTGGLNKAITDLRNHLKAAGVTGVQTGQVLTEMFGKKAGPGIAVLLGQYDRLQSKFKVLRESGASFADKWKATTQTASFALASLGHRAEALGIQLTGKLGPGIASTVHWLGTVVPQVVGALGPVWDVAKVAILGVAAALHALGAILGGVGTFIAQNHTLVGSLTVGFLALWTAVKVGAAVSAGIKSLSLALAGISLWLDTIGGKAGVFSRMAASITPARVATGVFAAGIGLVTAAYEINANRAAEAKARVDAWASALQESNGAINAHIRALMQQKLAEDGVYDAAAKYHIAAKTVTAASQGSTTAISAMLKATNGNYDAIIKIPVGIGKQTTALATAKRHYDQTAAATTATTKATGAHAAAAHAAAVAVQTQSNALGASADAYKAAQDAAKKSTDQTNAQTLAFQLENDAASLLSNALKGLAGINLDVATAQTGLASANLTVASSFKTNGNAIDGNSAKAVANQQAIQGQVQAAQQYAEAIGKQTGSSKAAVAALNSSKNALESQLKAQGELTPAVQAYIEKLYNIKNLKVPPTILDVNKAAAEAKIAVLQNRINAIRQGKDPLLDANSAPARGVIANLQAQIDRIQGKSVNITVTADISPAAIRAQNLLDNIPGSAAFRITNKTSQYAQGGTIPPNTRFTVGEQGWEGGVTDAQGRATIFSHPQSVAMGYKPPVGYASGTVSSLASLLASMGLTRAGIAGVLGNAQIESGLSLSAYNANENAHGLFQWEGGRWTALQSLARSLGVGSTSATAELAMLKRELSSMPGLLHTLQTTGSASNAAAAFDAIFERSSGAARSQRESAANSFLQQINSGGIKALGGGLSQSTGTSGALSAANALGKLILGGRNHTSGVSAQTVVADMQNLESALAKSGAPSGLVDKLTKQNQELSDAAAKRNSAAVQLQKANTAVANALNARTQDTATFKAAGVGIFDITTAGADANGYISAGSLRSAQQQDVTKIRKWSTDMKRLMRLGIFPATYLRQLLGKGPDALPTIDAILGMSTSDLKAFAANEQTIDTISGQVAQAGAKKLDDPAIIAAQKQAKFWNYEVAKYQHAIEHVVENGLHEVASEISRLNVSSRLQYKAGDLYIAVKTDEAKSAHRKPTK